MRIRQEDVDTWQQKDEKGFIRLIANHVVAEGLSGGLPEPALLEMVESGVARARRDHLREDAQITAFVTLMFEFCPNFDKHPVFRAILDNRALPEKERWQRMLGPQTRTAWEQVDAPEYYDEAEWFPELRDEPPDDEPLPAAEELATELRRNKRK